MKLEEIMVGDWIMFPNSIEKVQEVSFVEGKGYCASFAASATLFPISIDLLKPIPITPEILEKNGFKKYDVGHKVSGWSIVDEYYNTLIPFALTDNDCDTKPGEYKWGPVEDDREESFVREIGRINYVHELQHALRLCKIDKEIKL